MTDNGLSVKGLAAIYREFGRKPGRGGTATATTQESTKDSDKPADDARRVDLLDQEELD